MLSLIYKDLRFVYLPNPLSRARQATIPATCTTKEIYQAGCSLIEQNWSKLHPARLIGISLSGFNEDCSSDQMSLFDQMEDNFKKDKNKQIDEVMDKIRSKHGSEMITLAALLKKGKSSH